MARFIKFLSIFLLCLSFVLSEVMAEEVLTWEDCVKEARESHPDLTSAKEKIYQEKAQKLATSSALLPQISSSVTGKNSQAALKADVKTYSYDISGQQLLFDGFKTFYDTAQASEDIRAAQYNYKVTSSNIRLNLRVAFVKLLRAQELLQITEDIFKRRKQNTELVELRYKAGREHKGSLLTAQADLAQAEFEVTQARRNISLAQRRLSKELGQEKFVPVRVKENFVVADNYRQKPDFENLAKETPLLLELIAKKEAARLGVKSAEADFFPQVYTDVEYGKTASAWPPDKEEWSFGISVSLPLFEGGERLAEVSNTRAAFRQAQAEERSGRDGVILTLEETWTESQDAIDNVKVQKKFLEAAEERAKITQAQYSTGLISFDDWTIIEDTLVKNKKSFLDAQTSALSAEAYWVQARGGTLDED